MANNDVYVISAKRTPVGKARGVFKYTRPDDLLVHAIKSSLNAVPNFDLAQIGDVIIGCAMPEGEQGMNVARIASLLAGLPDSVPGYTINRFCSSGLQAVALAADKIRSGEEDVMLAGGVESMSRVPMGGFNYSANPEYFTSDNNLAIAYGMGITAEKVAARWQVSREQQDEFAVGSHSKALAAKENGKFAFEISPYHLTTAVPGDNGTPTEINQIVEHDEGPRKSDLNTLAGLRTAFAAKGSVTAGNSSQMSDGAAAVLLASEKFIVANSITPMARYLGFSVAGVPAEIMGIGPTAAIPKVLSLTGKNVADIDWIELNEAFAAQALAVIQECNLDPDKVNPHGGAIALGHPLGATGAIRVATLLHGMKQSNSTLGMVTMCIGTGMGAAGLFELV